MAKINWHLLGDIDGRTVTDRVSSERASVMLENDVLSLQNARYREIIQAVADKAPELFEDYLEKEEDADDISNNHAGSNQAN